MREEIVNLMVNIYNFNELPEADQALIEAAKKATQRSYAVYSNFHVGAAALLNDGTIVTGTNQENVSYPLGICAERTTLFYANSQYPDKPVDTLAIAAYTNNEFTAKPITPCGACRQVMVETENRYKHPMRILLYGTDCVYEILKATSLLPLSFGN
ncbi:cytidine deaminase [Bacteroides sp. 519]|uniref:cytidine deaminase n=1 Tax=Bacteroides sp. 519 TaxID=2302937 RepID=UPI0013D8D76A|nr:cytidine deaminase [Bacteroides sp. 519]NDV58296.1 cytidine deaminase [Bacteroides sp. 519]